LLRNKRPNVGETLLEIPPARWNRAKRRMSRRYGELAEETGYHAGHWRKLTAFYPSPGVLSERTHLYVASQLTPGEMHPEADEDLQPQIIEWKQVVAWALDGTIRDAKTLVAVLLWDKLQASGGR